MRGVRVTAVDLVDVLVYLVVLGVFIQLFPAVISESFLLALLTAVLLKVVLEVVTAIKKATIGRIRNAESPVARIANVAALLLVLPASKLVVLELVALVFGDAVQLGGFVQVTVLIVVLMLARGGVRGVLLRSAPTGVDRQRS